MRSNQVTERLLATRSAVRTASVVAPVSANTSEQSKDGAPIMSVTVSLQPDQPSALDGWRRQQAKVPSRAAALIILAARALTAKGAH